GNQLPGPKPSTSWETSHPDRCSGPVSRWIFEEIKRGLNAFFVGCVADAGITRISGDYRLLSSRHGASAPRFQGSQRRVSTTRLQEGGGTLRADHQRRHHPQKSL